MQLAAGVSSYTNPCKKHARLPTLSARGVQTTESTSIDGRQLVVGVASVGTEGQ